ncbi:MAG TPA: hypothetical protein VIS52_04715 [Motiliproteus sp.]
MSRIEGETFSVKREDERWLSEQGGALDSGKVNALVSTLRQLTVEAASSAEPSASGGFFLAVSA